MAGETFPAWLQTVVLAVITSGLATAGINYWSHDRELDIKMVEIGLSILKADPKEIQVSPAREWAINVVEKFSSVNFSPEDKEELKSKPVKSLPFIMSRNSDQHISTPAEIENFSRVLNEISKIEHGINNRSNSTAPSSDLKPSAPAPRPGGP